MFYDDEECSYSVLHNFTTSQEQCDYLQKCYEYKYFSLLVFNYCTVDNKQYITWPIIIIICALCFYFLSSTGNEYLSNILEILSEKLHLSQNLAGLTLLALGNQAPDIAAAFVAGEGAQEGIHNSLASLLGGGTFVIGIVLSSVIFFGKTVQVIASNYLRDLLVYFIAIASIFTISVFRKQFELWADIYIFSLYIFYVILCIIMDKYSNKKDIDLEDDVPGLTDGKDFTVNLFNEDESKSGKEEKEDIDIDIDNNKNEVSINNKEEGEENKDIDDEKNKLNKLSKTINDEDLGDSFKNLFINKMFYDKKRKDKENSKNKSEDYEDDNEEDNKEALSMYIKEEKDKKKSKRNKKSKKKDKFNISDYIEKSYYFKKSTIPQILKPSNLNDKSVIYNQFYYTVVKNLLTNGGDKNWKVKPLYGKIFYWLIDFPLDIIRYLTIPPFEQSKWKREFFTLQPLFIPLFISVICELFSYYKTHYIVFIAIYSAALILCIVFYKISYRTSLPKCEIALLFSAFVLSILWLWAATNLLMQMLDDIKMLLPIEIPESFLTMTVLAFGNSLPDFIVDVSLAKNGYAEMAISGSIGAPVFGILFGFGLAMIKKYIVEKKPAEFDILSFKTNTNIILIAMCCLVLCLSQLILYGVYYKFNLKRYPTSIIGFLIFGLYIIAIIVFTFIL